MTLKPAFQDLFKPSHTSTVAVVGTSHPVRSLQLLRWNYPNDIHLTQDAADAKNSWWGQYIKKSTYISKMWV